MYHQPHFKLYEILATCSTPLDDVLLLSLSSAASIQYTEPTIYYHTTTMQTTTFSKVEQSLDALDSRAQPVATEHVLPLTPIMQQLNPPFVIGTVHTSSLPIFSITY